VNQSITLQWPKKADIHSQLGTGEHTNAMKLAVLADFNVPNVEFKFTECMPDTGR
jgi:hypothetical protein